MRLIVTGKHGQLALSLIERCAACGVGMTAIGRPEVDLTKAAAVARAIEASEGDIVINAAAYTAVDKAEAEPDLATAINRDGARAVAEAAARRRLPVIQMSTDYVFNGSLDRPYREDDTVDPLGAYGRSKLAGERAVAEANDRHAVVRTAWVYSPFGQNFVRTMLRLGETRSEVNVVCDQWGAPSSALDLADALIAMSAALTERPDDCALRGVFHMTGSGFANWAGFAQAVFDEAARRGRPPVKVNPIATAQYPTPAKRPANSRLDTGKLARTYAVTLPEWRGSVAQCVERILTAGE
jgi:dTDP-4-dehydrorhamnose reductase